MKLSSSVLIVMLVMKIAFVDEVTCTSTCCSQFYTYIVLLAYSAILSVAV